MRLSARRASIVMALAALGLGSHIGQAAESASASMKTQDAVQAAFAPWDNVEDLLIEAIAGAQRQILVQAYLLTSKKIGNALIAAHRRGVDVRVLVDGEQLVKAGSMTATALAAAGIAVWIETKYQNAHNKVIVIDANSTNAAVITGSYNFTWTAQRKNAENILIIRRNPALTERYALNWERHRQDAMPYKNK
jgi:phosphatidylserine/phosphatidylglycerophosphate/cardiolipin synthase-like enzyme